MNSKNTNEDNDGTSDGWELASGNINTEMIEGIKKQFGIMKLLKVFIFLMVWLIPSMWIDDKFILVVTLVISHLMISFFIKEK